MTEPPCPTCARSAKPDDCPRRRGWRPDAELVEAACTALGLVGSADAPIAGMPLLAEVGVPAYRSFLRLWPLDDVRSLVHIAAGWTDAADDEVDTPATVVDVARQEILLRGTCARGDLAYLKRQSERCKAAGDDKGAKRFDLFHSTVEERIAEGENV